MKCSECEKSISHLGQRKVTDCPDCGVKPGLPHASNCDVEMCSACGDQRLQCSCPGHDREFARWTGFWPGASEALAMGLCLNCFGDTVHYQKLFIKPKVRGGGKTLALKEIERRLTLLEKDHKTHYVDLDGRGKGIHRPKG